MRNVQGTNLTILVVIYFYVLFILLKSCRFFFSCVVSRCKCPRFSGTNHRHSGTNALEICSSCRPPVQSHIFSLYIHNPSFYCTVVYFDYTLKTSFGNLSVHYCFYLHKIGHRAHTFKLRHRY